MTDWETTKIKGDVKEQAAELDATYTEVMQAGINAMEENRPTPEQNGGDAEAIADAVAERVGADAPVAWDQPDVSDLAEKAAEHIEQRDNVTLDASERRKIAQEVAEELR